MLFLAFIMLPVIEIWLLIHVGSAIGAFDTIILLFAAGFIGLALLRWQGFGMLMRVQRKLATGEPATQELLEGGMLAMAGVLFLLPGFFSDCVALLLLVPWLRRWWIRRWLAQRVMYTNAVYREHSTSSGRTIDGEWEHEQHDPKKLP